MTIAIIAFASVLWIASALSDLQTFKIPNRYVAALLCGWPIACLLTDVGTEFIAQTAALGGVLLVVGFVLFALGALGAGDVKLLAASVLWIGVDAALPFFLYTTLIGAGLGFMLLQLRAVPLPLGAYRVGWLVRLHERKRVMPYGIAIAGGGFSSLPQSALVLG